MRRGGSKMEKIVSLLNISVEIDQIILQLTTVTCAETGHIPLLEKTFDSAHIPARLSNPNRLTKKTLFLSPTYLPYIYAC